MTAGDAPETVTICERGRRGLYADDDGVTVRNGKSRASRFAWGEISRFADGSGQNEGNYYWVLVIVLQTGREVPVPCTRGSPAPETLEAVRQVAERHGIPADLTGAPMKDGRPAGRSLYQDPGGQAGLRFWDGEQWSPLLPLDLRKPRSIAVRQAPGSWPALPTADGHWAYPATRARRLALLFTVYATVSVALLTGGLIVELWWNRGAHHGHASGGTWFVFGGLAALSAYRAWTVRRFYLRLDEAANGAPGGVGTPVWAVGTPLPPEVTGDVPLPADVIGAGPAPRRRRIVPLMAAGISVVAAISATVIVLGSSSSHKPEATQARKPTQAGTPTWAPAVQRLLIDQLRPGDCLQGPPDVNTARWWPYVVTAIPCSEGHIAEVYFFSANYWPKDMAYPGHAKLVRQASAECRKTFQAYDGVPLSGSQLSFADMTPRNRGNWIAGDRLLLCTTYLWTPWYHRGQPMYDSIKHSDL